MRRLCWPPGGSRTGTLFRRQAGSPGCSCFVKQVIAPYFEQFFGIFAVYSGIQNIDATRADVGGLQALFMDASASFRIGRVEARAMMTKTKRASV